MNMLVVFNPPKARERFRGRLLSPWEHMDLEKGPGGYLGHPAVVFGKGVAADCAELLYNIEPL